MHVLLILGALCAAAMLGVSYTTNFLSLKDRLDILSGRKPPQATKADTDALAQQIKELEDKVTLGSEYLHDLPEAVNKKLRAAYQEARVLQLEGYEAQSREKHREAIDRFTRALALAEDDSQRAALHNLCGNSYFDMSDYVAAQTEYEESLHLAAGITPGGMPSGPGPPPLAAWATSTRTGVTWKGRRITTAWH